MKRRSFFSFLLLGLLIIPSITFGLKNILTVRAEEQPDAIYYSSCEYRANILSPLQNQEVSSGVMVRMAYESNLYVSEAFVLVDNTVVGAATHNEGTPSNEMQFPLDVRGLPLGSHKVKIKVRYYQSTSTTSSQICMTNEVIFKVVAPTSSTTTPIPTTTTQPTTTTIQPVSSLESVSVTIMPNSWQGPTNVNRQFEAKAIARFSNGAIEDVSDKAAFEWEVSIGQINTLGRNISFSSGPQPGQGELKARATFGTKSASTSIPITVQKVDSETAYPEATQDKTQITDEESLAKARREGDEDLKSCLNNVLQGTYTEAVSQNKRLRSNEIEKAQQCFAARRFVIPANLAPFEANKEKILQLPVDSKKIKINSAAQLATNQAKGIIFKGIAEPNKTILIYIFSEPLVLAAKTDVNGNWSYTLEDPLEPGAHEAFIAVEGENENDAKRSSSFGFAIASVTKTKENPLGLSLDLQNRSEPQTLYFLYSFVSGALTLGAIGVVVYLVRRKQKLEHLN